MQSRLLGASVGATASLMATLASTPLAWKVSSAQDVLPLLDLPFELFAILVSELAMPDIISLGTIIITVIRQSGDKAIDLEAFFSASVPYYLASSFVKRRTHTLNLLLYSLCVRCIALLCPSSASSFLL